MTAAVNPERPAVLCFSGNDPSGGAGLAADITAIHAHACHACPVPTALTVQDSRNVSEVHAVDAELLQRQAESILRDTQIGACKIGICGSPENVETIASLLGRNPGVPVVTDPIIRASGGYPLAESKTLAALRTRLIPRTTVLVPNRRELGKLSPDAKTPREASETLLEAGCQWVLVTDGDGRKDQVTNLLFGADGTMIESTWPRLQAEFHGSGCTLAASIAAQIALGKPVPEASDSAQAYTWNCLDAAIRTGRGRLTPLR